MQMEQQEASAALQLENQRKRERDLRASLLGNDNFDGHLAITDKELMQRQRKISQIREKYNLPRNSSRDSHCTGSSPDKTCGQVKGAKSEAPHCFY